MTEHPRESLMEMLLLLGVDLRHLVDLARGTTVLKVVRVEMLDLIGVVRMSVWKKNVPIGRILERFLLVEIAPGVIAAVGRELLPEMGTVMGREIERRGTKNEIGTAKGIVTEIEKEIEATRREIEIEIETENATIGTDIVEMIVNGRSEIPTLVALEQARQLLLTCHPGQNLLDTEGIRLVMRTSVNGVDRAMMM
jgi:hypothetical protein